MNNFRKNIANALINSNYSSETQEILDKISDSIDQAWKLYGGKEGLPSDEFIQEWCEEEDFTEDFGEEFEENLKEIFNY